MESFPDRLALAKALFAGEGAELGVAGGSYSDEILRHCPAVTLLWSIDRWSDHHNVLEYWSAADRLAVHGARSRVRRCTFTEASMMIPDEALDWCYVDGYAHSGQDGGQTLEEWWPKIRPGGILAGHDYHPDWPATVAAVEAFVDRHTLKMGFSNEYAKDRGEWPSWWVRKP